MTIISQNPIAQAGNTNTTATATTTTETKGNAQMTTSQKQANEAKNAIDQIMHEYQQQCWNYEGRNNCEAKTENCYDAIFDVSTVKTRILAMQEDTLTKQLRTAVVKRLKDREGHYGHYSKLADKIELVFSSRLQKSVLLPFDITEQDLDAELEKVKHLQFVDVLYRGMLERSFHGKILGRSFHGEIDEPFICIATDIHFALCEILDFEDGTFDPCFASNRVLWFAHIK